MGEEYGCSATTQSSLDLRSTGDHTRKAKYGAHDESSTTAHKSVPYRTGHRWSPFLWDQEKQNESWCSFVIISEWESTIGPDGELTIPADVIAQMGLRPADSVYVAYITDDALKNQYREFFVSSHPLDTPEGPSQISIPAGLLRDAGISEDTEVQIVCVDGAIILCRDFGLRFDELALLLRSLDIADNIAKDLPQDANAAIESLHEYINNFEERS